MLLLSAAGLMFCLGWISSRLHAEFTIIARLQRRIDQLYQLYPKR